MASSGLQLLGFVLALFGLIATLVATCMSEWKWKQSSKEDTFVGLWEECTIDRDGKKLCDPHESMLDLTNDLQAIRVGMMVSIFLSGGALVVSLFGMKCTRLLDDRDQPKGTVALVGGLLLLISGLLTLIITSWFVTTIVQAYNNRESRNEFASAVFVSWGGSVLTLAGGTLLCCRRCSCARSSVTSPKLHPLQAGPQSDYV